MKTAEEFLQENGYTEDMTYPFFGVTQILTKFANQKEEYSESGIEELDSLVKKYQNKEISFLTFVSDVWNVAYAIGKLESKSQLKDIISPEKFRVLAEWIDKIDLELGRTDSEVQDDLRSFAEKLEL